MKTTAHATNTDASDHASVADTERRPSARATSQPGSSTSAVPKARRRYSITRAASRALPEARKLIALAVLGPPQDERAQAQREQQQPAGTLGLTRARGASRGSAAWPRRFSTYSRPPCDAPPTCVDLGVRVEPDRPAGPPEARLPVDLLAEHEEVLIEQADRIGGIAADEQRGAGQPIGLPRLVVREPPTYSGLSRLRARCELADEEVLGREPPERRLAADRALERAVGVLQLRADDRRVRVRRRRRRSDGRGVAFHPGVGVEQEEVAPARRHACRRCCHRPCRRSPARRAACRGTARGPARRCRRSSRCRRPRRHARATESRQRSTCSRAFHVTTTTETSGRSIGDRRTPRRRRSPRAGSQRRAARAGSSSRRRGSRTRTPGRRRRRGLPRKLTKNASRTPMPLTVNGTSITRKSSGPSTTYGSRRQVDADGAARGVDRKHARQLRRRP